MDYGAQSLSNVVWLADRQVRLGSPARAGDQERHPHFIRWLRLGESLCTVIVKRCMAGGSTGASWIAWTHRRPKRGCLAIVGAHLPQLSYFPVCPIIAKSTFLEVIGSKCKSNVSKMFRLELWPKTACAC